MPFLTVINIVSKLKYWYQSNY